MKRVLFFSLEDGWLGGVARVNCALQPALREAGFQVDNLYLRGCRYPLPLKGNDYILRKNCPWEFITGRQIKEALRAKKPLSAIGLLLGRIWDEARGRLDFRQARRYIRAYKPDCIVVTSYLLLPAIPEEYLACTLHHVHTSLGATLAQKANANMLRRFNGKIGFLWLSRGICREAEKKGFQNCFYVYNPLSFYPEERTEAEEKRLISVITRFSEEKRLPLAVSLLKRAMDQVPEKEFHVEFWGTGPEENALRRAVAGDPRFALCGETREPYAHLLDSRLTVNTSAFEGFSISILEAASAGVPAIAFHFGEAAEEEILDEKTGVLIPMDHNEEYVRALVRLLSDDDHVKALSLGAREHASRFIPSRIAEDWEVLLSNLPLKAPLPLDKKGNL